MNASRQNPTTSRRKVLLGKASNYLLGYLLFTVIMAALFFLLFQIRMDTILLFTAMGYNIIRVSVITSFAITIAALTMMVGAGFAKDRLRNAIEKNRMWKVLLRIYLVTGAAWIIYR